MKKSANPFWEVLSKADNALSKLEEVFIYAGLILMVFMSFFQVIARNLFSYGFVWVDDLLRHLVLWTGFLGASLATKNGKHINIDVFTRLLPDGAFKYVKALTLYVSAFAGGLLSYASWKLVEIEREFPDVLASLHIPVWVLELIFPIAFLIITLRFFFQGTWFLINGKVQMEERK